MEKWFLELYNLSKFEHSHFLRYAGKFPWDTIENLESFVSQFGINKLSRGTLISPLAEIDKRAIIGNFVVIGPYSKVEPGACILGGAIIGRDCTVMARAEIRENVVLGAKCTVNCQIENSILLDGVKAKHGGFIGHSIVGNNVNIADGATLSDFRNDKQNIKVHHAKGRSLATSRRKLGSYIGDDCMIGCHVTVNPGSVLSKGVQVDPGLTIRGFFPPYHRVYENDRKIKEALLAQYVMQVSQNGGRR